MFLVGLTGGIACGKSTVTTMLRDLGVEVVDCDAIAHEVIKPGRKAYIQIKKQFGSEVLSHDGTISRGRLGAIIFEDPSLRAELNRITHPEIQREIGWQVLKSFLKFRRYVVVDSPLLYEANTAKFFHIVAVVSCKYESQIRRIMHRDELPKPEAISRIKSQMPLEDKCSLGDYVIKNDKSIQDTRAQVFQLFMDLESSNMHKYVRFYIFAFLALLGFAGGLGYVMLKFVITKLFF